MKLDTHWLKNHFKSWTTEKLLEQKQTIIRFSGSEIELEMIELELKRREAEEVA